MTAEFVDHEVQNPDTPFEPRKYRVRYRCADCGHEWKSRWYKAIPKKDEPCPNPAHQATLALRQAQWRPLR